MAISKVILNGTTLMDVTQDTVAADKVLYGETAHKNDGTNITGNITSKTSSDLTASGATVTVPAGYYASNVSKSIASGSEGTPIATKGTVSNHSITVTPSVTNSAGYISGSTKTGTGVTVSVSELESGTKTITENGTGISVSGYADVDVDVEPDIESLIITPSTSQQVFSTYASEATITINNGTYSNIAQEGTIALYYIDFSQLQEGKTYYVSGIAKWDETTITFNGEFVYNFTYSYSNYTYTDSLIYSPTYSENSNAPQSITIFKYDNGYKCFAWGGKRSAILQVTSPITFKEKITVDGYFPITVAGVTTTNLIAENIKSGVTIKIGDSDNNDKIASITGTYQPNTQTKTITPGTSTQVIVPDNTITVLDNYTQNSSTYSQYGVITLYITTSNIPSYTTYPYCKLNGVINIDNGSATVTCTDVIIPITLSSIDYNLVSYFGETLASGVTITSGSNYISSNVRYVTFYYRSNSIKIEITFDTQGVYGQLQNFTCIFGTSNEFLDYDALSQVTINAMPSGTAGTPTATKGSVSNNSISITPSVTNTTGYITGSTITGTAVTVSASELVSGTKSITENGTNIDVTNYAVVNVAVEATGGNDNVAEEILTKTISTYTNPTISCIGAYAFTQCSSLSYVSLATCSVISNYAFASCTNLKEIYIPEVQSISMYAFFYCSNLKSINIPNCNKIGAWAFSNCLSLKTIESPSCTIIENGAFCKCSALTTVSFPECTSANTNIFSSCEDLAEAYFPKLSYVPAQMFMGCSWLSSIVLASTCSYVGSSAFLSCRRLTSISLPNCISIYQSAFAFMDLSTLDLPVCVSIGTQAFRNNSNLSIVSLPMCSLINAYTFVNCSSLSQLYLMNSSMTALSNSNAFQSTKIASGTGSIYVPASLLTEYQTATNWIEFSSQFIGV